MLRGLDTAIVDEADSILIDEAVTPLIISADAANSDEVEAYRQAAHLAARLSRGADYEMDDRHREVNLTREGKAKLARLTADLGGLWAGRRRREELVSQAIGARELYTAGKQYVVDDGKVTIVDEFTGRLMPDRTWRDGLHQAVEAKEGLSVNTAKATLARMSFQRFFRQYEHLGGMTGTAWEARHELWQIYGMPTVVLPTHRPCVRVEHPLRICANSDARWRAVVAEITRVHAEGRPVLVGTRSVEASEHLSRLLTASGLEHCVLNAVRHAEEARIVAEAGQPGRVTVATNMAGRGTDIELGPGVAARGGLHVVATERHESGRIDRQLAGRAARQGDPGSAVAIVSRDDELYRRYLRPSARRLVDRLLAAEEASDEAPRDSSRVSALRSSVRRAIARGLLQRAQHTAERMSLAQRKSVLRTDDWLDQFLGFAGRES